ncbi:MAG: DUF1579 family protein [Gemmatimonadaceae bacterium]
MSLAHSLTSLLGDWRGTNVLYRPWVDPSATQSPATARVESVVNDNFVTISYTWACDGDPHTGLFVIGHAPADAKVTATWIDSWHQSAKIMYCEGSIAPPTGVISFHGTYAAPPDPDWGWRTEITPRDGVGFDIVMYNITPAGEEAVAVESRYSRAAGA